MSEDHACRDQTDVDWIMLATTMSKSDDFSSTALGHLDQIRKIARFNSLIISGQDPVRILGADDAVPYITDNDLEDSGATPDTWCHLKLRELIGQGAHADVYRAWDPRLDCEVALKLYRRDNAPAESAAVSLAARRDKNQVIREGQLLAKVKHENVVTVHGAEEGDDGRVGIWMDFIRGRALDEVLAEQSTLSARETELIGLDICRALAAVHAQGIVHLDVKAQNVMREDGGRIVLMDFGVGVELAVGHDGHALGTPLYMAPEVLRHGEVSERSDIYGLGVLLFHLVTGRFPYEAADVGALIDAHTQDRRHLLRDLRPDLSRTFIDVVDGALQPEPADRFRSMGEMEAAITASHGSTTTSIEVDRSALGRRPVWQWLGLAAVVLALIGGWAWRIADLGDSGADITGSTPSDLVSWVTHTPLSDDGRVFDSAISPDGNYLAYACREEGGYSLRLKQIHTGNERVLLPREQQGIWATVFSPDGQFVYFTLSKPTYSMTNLAEFDLYRVSILGGSPQKLQERVLGRRFACAPDGSRLAYFRIDDSRRQLLTCSTNGSDEQVITSLPITPRLRPVLSWSANGSRIYTIAHDSLSGSEKIVALQVSGAASEDVGETPWQAVLDIQAPAAGDVLLVVGMPAGEDKSLITNLWRVQLDTGRLEALTNDTNMYYQVSTDQSGHQLAIHAYDSKRVLRILGVASPNDYRDLWPGDMAQGRVVWTPSGRLLTHGRAGSSVCLKYLNLAGAQTDLIISESKYVADMAVSADGDILAYTSYTGQDFMVWLADAQGGSQRRLLPETGHTRYPQFVPDGSVLIYGRRKTANDAFHLYRYTFATNRHEQLCATPAVNAWISPDGSRVAAVFLDEESGSYRPGTVAAKGGEVEFLNLAANFRPLGWHPDGLSMVCLNHDETTPNLWRVPLDGTTPSSLTEFPALHRNITDVSWNAAGDSLVTSLEVTTFDAVLLEVSDSRP